MAVLGDRKQVAEVTQVHLVFIDNIYRFREGRGLSSILNPLLISRQEPQPSTGGKYGRTQPKRRHVPGRARQSAASRLVRRPVEPGLVAQSAQPADPAPEQSTGEPDGR